MNLYKSESWEVIFVSWCQEFPGQCIISSKKESLSDLTKEEWIELGKLEKELERVTKEVFNATMYNFAALMNNAYRDKEKPHVHFQFVPRYDSKRIILGKKYKDKHFGYNFWKYANNKLKCQKDIFTKFDYFDSVIDNDDIPYTGNKELVKVILCHYYGHYGKPPKGIPEIKKLLSMENANASNLSSAISYLMLAVCKYKDGIKLKPLPSYDDIKSYYEKYHDILDKGDRKAFLTYFKRVQKRSIGEDIIIPNGQVLFALAKEAGPDLLDYRNMTKENALKILYTYGKVLSPTTRNTLQHYFEIPNKDLMSSKEKIKVRRMIELLIINRVKGETLKREND